MIRKNDFLIMGDVAYVTPSVSVQALQNEGLLCTSVPGASIENGTEEDWGTL